MHLWKDKEPACSVPPLWVIQVGPTSTEAGADAGVPLHPRRPPPGDANVGRGHSAEPSPGRAGAWKWPCRSGHVYDTVNSGTNIDFSSKSRACLSGLLLAPRPSPTPEADCPAQIPATKAQASWALRVLPARASSPTFWSHGSCNPVAVAVQRCGRP